MFLRSVKEVNRLLNKGISNVYLNNSYREKPMLAKLQFSKFSIFVARLVFCELQLTQVSLNFKTSCCNLTLHGKCPNKEFFLVRIQENTDQKKLCIWTLFTQFKNQRVCEKWSVFLFMLHFLNISFLTEMYPHFSREKALLIITHDRKGIYNFPHTILNSFMITARVHLPYFEKYCLMSKACQSSNWANFWHNFLGRQDNYRIFPEQFSLF